MISAQTVALTYDQEEVDMKRDREIKFFFGQPAFRRVVLAYRSETP
jgi:hypothetical protein